VGKNGGAEEGRKNGSDGKGKEEEGIVENRGLKKGVRRSGER
jgi:hypothetical protein